MYFAQVNGPLSTRAVRLPGPRRLFRLCGAAAYLCAAAFSSSGQDTTTTVAPPPDTIETDTTGSSPDTTEAAPSPKKEQGLTDTVRYEADEIRYDLGNRIVYLSGHAKAMYQDVTLHADTITYDIGANLFLAQGTPKLIEGSDVTVGDTLRYNIKTRRGSVTYATTQLTDEYFTGKSIVKSRENHLYITDGDYTSCANLEHPHYTFYGRRLKIIPKKKAMSSPVVLNIGEAPVAVFPYYIMPLERGRTSGILTPGWGGHPTRGGYLDNLGYYWVPNDYMDFLLSGRVKEFNDLVLTGRARYKLRYWLDGSITGNYHIGSDYRATSQQWTLSFAHNQNLLPDGSFTLRGNGRLESSKVDDKTFSEQHSYSVEDVVNQDLHANLALSKRLPRLNSSINIGWNRSHNLQRDLITEDLPSFSFGLPNRQLIPQRDPVPDARNDDEEPKWYNNITYSYSVDGKARRVEYQGRDTLGEYYRPGLSQSIRVSAPQKLFKYITISPSFSARHSMIYGYWDTTVVDWDTIHPTVSDTLPYLLEEEDYSKPGNDLSGDEYFAPMIDTLLPEDPDDPDADTLYRLTWTNVVPDSIPQYGDTTDAWGHDATWDAGLSISTRLFGLYKFRFLNFVGMRHTLTPSVSYSFVPEHTQDKFFYPVVRYDAGHRRRQIVSLNLGNLFQGKIERKAKEPGGTPEEHTFKICDLSLSTSYDFEAKKNEKSWGDLALGAGTDLKFMRLSFSSSFWLHENGEKGGGVTWPIMRSYRLNISPNNFAVGGDFWGGDRLVLDGVNAKDPVTYRNAGPQQWRLSLSPAFSLNASRLTPEDVLKPTRNYSLGASASLNFTRNWSVSWSSKYDFVKGDFTSHSLNFACDLECWNMIFNWTPKGVLPGYYYFRVNIKKIPDIKWEERD